MSTIKIRCTGLPPSSSRSDSSKLFASRLFFFSFCLTPYLISDKGKPRANPGAGLVRYPAKQVGFFQEILDVGYYSSPFSFNS